MIYDSNLSVLEAKLNQNVSAVQGLDDSAMQMMESIQSLVLALSEEPNNYSLNVQAGNAYFDIGRFHESAYYYKKALTIHDHDVNVAIDLGVCYFNLSKLDSALIYMRSALSREPDHKQGLYNIGIVYYNLGQSANAEKYWKHLVHSYPESNEGRTANRFLEEIEKQKSGI